MAADEPYAAAALAGLWSAHDYLWPAELDGPPMTSGRLPALIAVWAAADAFVRDRMVLLFLEAVGGDRERINSVVASLEGIEGPPRERLLATFLAAEERRTAARADAGAEPGARQR